MAHKLPPLPYDFGALEPHIDAKTMEIHHDKHHNAYVNNLNKALEGHPDLAAKSIEELLAGAATLPDSVRQPIINHGGGHAAHALLWTIMGPHAGGEPTGPLADDINATFGGFAQFKDQLSKAAATHFGSGWAWLCVDGGGKLLLYSTANQDSPLSRGHTPIMTLDVWEHAYYLNYQNRRPDYIAAWWNVVNWNEVAARYAKAKAKK
ncbi:MAG TPA: superoxide dismutase [Phycisphaerae bacterium]|nr:superoxide dismutase [Phycisphaerae bacterium]